MHPNLTAFDAEVGPGSPDWIPLDKMPKHLLHALISAEDAKFYEHAGFDFEAIRKTIEFNLKKKKYARGASTISQQLVKMAFLSRKKNLVRKGREAVGTVLLELILDKREILEWYLNLAEFGPDIYGVKQAARHYFKTKPQQLSLVQSVQLVSILPSPVKWSTGLRQRRLTSFGQQRFAAIATNLKLGGYISEQQWYSLLSQGNFGAALAGRERYIARFKSKKSCFPSEPCYEILHDLEDQMDQRLSVEAQEEEKLQKKLQEIVPETPGANLAEPVIEAGAPGEVPAIGSESDASAADGSEGVGSVSVEEKLKQLQQSETPVGGDAPTATEPPAAGEGQPSSSGNTDPIDVKTDKTGEPIILE